MVTVNKTRKLRHNLKVAILFSGRIKGYKHVMDHLSDLKQMYNPVFFCSLNKKGLSPYIQGFCKFLRIERPQLHLEPTVVPEYVKKIVEHPYNRRYNVYSVLYHNKKVLELVEKYQIAHNMQFDVILLYRADLFPDPGNMLNLVKPVPNTVYIPAGDESIIHPKKWPRKYGINSMIAYGDYPSMEKYCSAVDNIATLSKESDVAIHHEGIIQYNIMYTGLKVKRFVYDTNLHPSRHNNLKEYNNYE